MSACPTKAQLGEWLGGRRPVPDFASHLENCASCRAAADDLRQEDTLLAEVRALAPKRQGLHADSSTTLPAGPEGYEIISMIAQGGQGAVYRAVQKAARRTVALKILAGGPFATARQRHRFDREIELVAALRHPHIVTLYDSGTTHDGRPYLAMEYVQGVPLDEHVRKVEKSKNRKVEIGAMLRLFAKICDAVNYAHQRGIIHRDLKPANILVVCNDQAGLGTEDSGLSRGRITGKPDSVLSTQSSALSLAEPRILDFGLAKALEDPIGQEFPATKTGEFQGTLAYAAPEQVQGAPALIDTRTDVYALGVMLYEALTGQHPYPATGAIADVVRQIVEAEPAPLRGSLDDELETIVLKALAKDKERRYSSARDLAQDLDRYLAGEPIHAKSDSAWYLLRKAARRHRAPILVAVAILLLVIVFGVTMSIQAGRIARQRDQLADALGESNVERARLVAMTGNLPAAEDVLWREFLRDTGVGRAEGIDQQGRVPASRFAHWALWELYAREPCLATWAVEGEGQISFSRDNERLTILAQDDIFRQWDTRSGRLVVIQSGPSGTVTRACHDAAGKRWIVALEDSTVALWDVAESQYRVLPGIHLVAGSGIDLSADGETLAMAGADGIIRLWDLPSGRRRGEDALVGAGISVIYLSPDGRLVAAAGKDDAFVRIWRVGDDGGLTLWDSVPDTHANRLCLFSPDGSALAFKHRNADDVVIWDIQDRRPQWTLAGHGGQIHSVGFSADGRRIAVGGTNGVTKIFDLDAQRWIATYSGHAAPVRQVRISPDGRLLATWAPDGAARLWEMPPAACPRQLEGPADSVLGVCFSPDGRLLAAAAVGDAAVRVWSVSSGERAHVFVDHSIAASAVAFRPDGKSLASAGHDGRVNLWDLSSGALVKSFQAERSALSTLAFSPDGTVLATAGDDRIVRLWELTEEVKLLREIKGHINRIPYVTFSPEGRLLASAGREGTVMLWEAASGRCRGTLTAHGGAARWVQFSSDGTRLLSGGDDGTVRLWDVAEARCIRTFAGHSGEVYAATLSLDDRMIASGDRSGTVRLWDVASGRNLARLSGPDVVYSVSFSPDGRWLAAGGIRPTSLVLWDLTCFDRHIAGNLEFQLGRLGSDDFDPERVARLRAWAAEVLAKP